MAPSILVLEDNDEMRRIMADVLEAQGYQVTAVARGLEAVEAAAHGHFDLIVADIVLDGMNGLEAVEMTRRHQPEIGTLIVSGYATPENLSRARALNTGGILRKPFELKQFVGLVQEQLAQGQREERTETTDSSARDGLLWALGALAQAADQAPRAVSAARVRGLTERLALAAGLSEPVSHELGLAAVLATGPAVPPEFYHDHSLLPALKTALRHLHHPWDLQPTPPLEARVVAVATLAAESEWASGPELARQHPGRLDPELLRLYQNLADEPAPSRARPAPSQRSRNLLSLARALVEVGDHTSAERAYREVLADGLTREAVLALLGLARLGQAEADEAVAMARKLGPVLFAETLLESGLLLFSQRQTGAAERLRQAATELDRLGLEGGLARAVVALMRLGESPAAHRLGPILAALTDPRYGDEIGASAHWLVGEALQLLPGLPDACRAVVARLACHYPDYSLRALDSLAREARLSLVSQFEHYAPPELLERLGRDPDPEVRAVAARLHQTAAPAPLIRVRSFGLFEVLVGEEPITDKQWKTKKTKFFLAFLASQWGRPVSEDQVMDAFWPGDRNKGKQNLYWATSVARRCLRVESGPELLERRHETLLLSPEVPHFHDLDEFEAAYQAGRQAQTQGQIAQARAAYRRMGGYYTATYLEGYYQDWAVRRRDAVEQTALDGFCRLADCSLSEQDPREALEATTRALDLDSCRQEAHLLAMQAYLELGQPEAAIEQFRTCERALRQEYDIEPNTSLLEAYQRARLHS
ncbi:MAG: response regulator [Candidatus Eremiobacteraeota bacterium]|nr:response regulator [Candidatus Eremiobacteraeota bacterium]